MNNQWFSKVAVWLIIAMVLFTVFKQFDTRGGMGSGTVSYSEFLDQVRNNAPLIVVLLVVAALLLARGGLWMQRLTDWLLTKTHMRGRNLISGFVSLGQVAVPMVGAPFIMNFMLPVPLASLPAVEICWDTSLAGISCSARDTR